MSEGRIEQSKKEKPRKENTTRHINGIAQMMNSDKHIIESKHRKHLERERLGWLLVGPFASVVGSYPVPKTEKYDNLYSGLIKDRQQRIPKSQSQLQRRLFLDN